MGIEIQSATIVCAKCGRGYSKRQSNFYVSHGIDYKGTGYLHICKSCVETLFNNYLATCVDAKKALRQLCRRLNLYWNDAAFDYVFNKSPTKDLLTAYITKINNPRYSGKSYDDTLTDEGTLWDFSNSEERKLMRVEENARKIAAADFFGVSLEEAEEMGYGAKESKIPEEVIAFWGPSYTPDMYAELEQRRQYWMSRFPEGIELDVGTEALIRQICSLEIDINRDRADGKPVDKLVGALNTLLGSAQLKPAQKSTDAKSNGSNTPFGVWIKRWEDERPIPEVDPSLKDVDGIKKYIATWFHGHLAKMLGLKKAELKLYEEEIERLRVERPEFDGEDDEEMLNDFFSEFNTGEADEREQ